MALTDLLVSVSVYRSAVGLDGTSNTNEIKRELEAAQRFWETKLRRFFTKSASASERRFYVHRAPSGDGSRVLYVSDIATAAGVEVSINGTEVDSDAYELWPLNAALEPEPRPYESIVRKSGCWPLGEVITVEAVWGWPNPPAAVIEAIIEWCAVWRGESVRATARVAELEEVQSVSPYHLSMLRRIVEGYQVPRTPRSGVLV